jgi:hypothetical protein
MPSVSSSSPLDHRRVDCGREDIRWEKLEAIKLLGQHLGLFADASAPSATEPPEVVSEEAIDRGL